MSSRSFLLAPLMAGLLLGAPAGADPSHAAGAPATAPATEATEIHPVVPLLDGQGRPIGESGGDLSFAASCGKCHDVAWIEQRLEPDHRVRSPGVEGVDCLACHLASDLERPTHGELAAGIRSPPSSRCGVCHQRVHEGPEPMRPELDGRRREQMEVGEVFSGQRLSETALVLADKDRHDHPFDIHAARMLRCTSCHASPSHPAVVGLRTGGGPAKLRYDPRGADLAEHLRHPDHRMAGTGLTCTDCHEAARGHGWLPHAPRHLEALACQVCHVPEIHQPARMAINRIDGVSEWRGVEGDPSDPLALIRGYQPVLLPRRARDGKVRLHPANLLTGFSLVEGRPQGVVEARFVFHDVVTASSALRDCDACHSRSSRTRAPMTISDRPPQGAAVVLKEGPEVAWNGRVERRDGRLEYHPPEPSGYLPGAQRSDAVNGLGLLMVLGALLGVGLHGGLRVRAALRSGEESGRDEA